MNETPRVPVAVFALVILGGGGATMVVVRVLLVLVPAALVALIVVEVVPAAVGTPEMIPVVVLKLVPGGNPVAVKLVGLLLAVI